MSRRVWLVLAWVGTTALAITVGVLAVSTVGATIRERGPLGDDVVLDATQPGQAPTGPARDAPAVREKISGEYGSFTVECRDTWAIGVKASANRADGWRIVSFEKGPDDDVDAVFSDGRNSVDLEVFCNAGRPTLAELERNTLGDDSDDG